ncbi:MAG: thiamine phosphate synthase, partial [Magnetococcales bacterium]|nr:thiamine phosphate synthase [Magnetococcales bacterium]
RLLGRSCHDLNGALTALEQGADYLTLSPVFATRSHPHALPLGLEKFAGLCRKIPGPVLALGGITPENSQKVRQAGAFGVALIRGILSSPNPEQAAQLLLKSINFQRTQ